MKSILTLTCLLVTQLSFAQLKSVVVDSVTGESIAYVNIWVENGNAGTTSDQQGAFELAIEKPQIIVFSAIGYETRSISSDSIKSTVTLTPAVIVLEQVEVVSKRKNKSLTIGEIRKSKVNHFFGCGGMPWVAARYFAYDEAYSNTPYLAKVRVLTNSDIQDSRFKVRLYSVNENGGPGNYLYDKNIFGIARKGKKFTDVDLTNLDIEFPEAGFFVAIEWLIIDENLHEYTYTNQGSNKRLTGTSFEPSIGTVWADTDDNSWVFIGGHWRKALKNNFGDAGKRTKPYSLIAVELTLTN